MTIIHYIFLKHDINICKDYIFFTFSVLKISASLKEDGFNTLFRVLTKVTEDIHFGHL
jgi:hypothetical protein